MAKKKAYDAGKKKTLPKKSGAKKGDKEWANYEEVARYVLNELSSEFGFEYVEGKQKVKGQIADTEWEVDAKGVCELGQGIFLVECRRYTQKRQTQEQVGALAFRISQTGAKGGIVVSPLGLQAGGRKIADAKNIVSVTLSADSTPKNFSVEFFNKLMYVRTTSIEFGCKYLCEQCGNEFTLWVKPKEGERKLCEECRSKN